MHIPDLHDYQMSDTETQEAKAKEFLTPEHKKLVAESIYYVMDEQYNKLEDYAAEFLENCASSRAESFFKKVLSGDKDAALALFGDRLDSDRFKQLGIDSGEPWVHLIRGSIFETDGIKMRRQLVEAHPDIITSERIKDLESIVEGLKQQIKKQDKEIERLRQMY